MLSKKDFLLASSIAASVAFTAPVHAGDSPERVEITTRSKRSGFGVSAVNLLSRKAGRGTDAVASDLLAALQKSGSRRSDASGVTVEGTNWQLAVTSEGRSGRYTGAAAPGSGIAPSTRLGDPALISTARAFVDGGVGAAIGIDPAELVPLKIKHQLRQGRAKGADSADPIKLVSSLVVFGRQVGGLPVVGPGSKIHVEISATGAVVGFNYDWSPLAIGQEKQTVLANSAIVVRANRHGQTKRRAAGDFDRFECGYFDVGAKRADADAPLQPACLVQETPAKNGQQIGENPVEEIVPAGVSVRSDRAWRLAERIAGREISSPIPPAAK